MGCAQNQEIREKPAEIPVMVPVQIGCQIPENLLHAGEVETDSLPAFRDPWRGHCDAARNDCSVTSGLDEFGERQLLAMIWHMRTGLAAWRAWGIECERRGEGN